MATLRDVALQSGVSTATVSYVLSGKGKEKRISEATRKKVVEAAQALGYQLAMRGAVAKTERPKIAIFWVVDELEMVMPPFLNGIAAATNNELFPIDIIIRAFRMGHLDDKFELWEAGYYDAAVIVAASQQDLDIIQKAPPAVPLVLINRVVPGVSSVSIDHSMAMKLLLEHGWVNAKGDMALVLNEASLYSLTLSAKELLEVYQKKGFDTRNRIFYSQNQIDNGYEIGIEMVRSGAVPKVILCVYDMVAMGIISALTDEGIEVGSVVQVLATSNGPERLFARMTPSLTVVDLKMKEVAERGVKLAIDIAMKRVDQTHQIKVYPSMIYRKSSPQHSSFNEENH